MKVGADCMYRVRGNLCRFPDGCSAKDYYDQTVNLGGLLVYGKCTDIPVFE